MDTVSYVWDHLKVLNENDPTRGLASAVWVMFILVSLEVLLGSWLSYDDYRRMEYFCSVKWAILTPQVRGVGRDLTAVLHETV